jgi:hypothetical protein
MKQLPLSTDTALPPLRHSMADLPSSPARLGRVPSTAGAPASALPPRVPPLAASASDTAGALESSAAGPVVYGSGAPCSPATQREQGRGRDSISAPSARISVAVPAPPPPDYYDDDDEDDIRSRIGCRRADRTTRIRAEAVAISSDGEEEDEGCPMEH